jgi:hypothetical protein
MGIRMTRRELALAAAGVASSARAQNASPPSRPLGQPTPDPSKKSDYAGPLDGLDTRVDLETFDPVRWTMRLHDSAPLKLSFRATTRKQAEGFHSWPDALKA